MAKQINSKQNEIDNLNLKTSNLEKQVADLQKEVKDDEEAETVTEDVTTTPVADSDYLNWNTYRDNKFDYELRYPEDWSCEIETDQVPKENIADRIVVCKQESLSEVRTIPSLTVNTITVFNEENARDWLLNNATDPQGEINGVSVPAESNIEIAGVDGFRVDYQAYEIDGTEAGEGITIGFIKDDVMYWIYANMGTGDVGATDVVQILESFSIQ